MAKSTQDALRHGENLGHTPAISAEEIKKRIKMEWNPDDHGIEMDAAFSCFSPKVENE